jgi:hypothetical protein
MVSLRSIFIYYYDRSTQSFDPEVLEGQNSLTLAVFFNEPNFQENIDMRVLPVYKVDDAC